MHRHRHRLYVISRLGDRYRTLAIVQHLRLYGYAALWSCLRLCTIFESPVNHEALRTEVNLAKNTESSLWDCNVNRFDPDVPFPFITSCLTIGASFSLARQHNSIVRPLSLSFRFDYGSENQGVTIIDITDLSRVRYCFMKFPGRMATNDDVRPLNAQEYLQSCCPSKRLIIKQSMLETVRNLEQRSLVDVKSLDSVWPHQRWNVASNSRTESTANHNHNVDRTLRQVALKRFLNELFEQDPDLDHVSRLLAHANQLADFAQALRTKLYTEPGLVTSRSAGFHLLQDPDGIVLEICEERMAVKVWVSMLAPTT